MPTTEIKQWADAVTLMPTEKQPIPYATEGASARVYEVVGAIEECEEYEGLAYNARSEQLVVRRDTPMPWDERSGRLWGEADDLNMLCELEEGKHVKLYHETKNGEAMTRIAKNTVLDAIKTVANKRKYDPLKAALNALPEWDGVKRGGRWAVDMLGAEDSEYTRAACWLFCSGAIARAYNPGEKFDYMIVLKGPQGLGKSTALRKLALLDDLFADNIGDMRTRESMENLLDTWIVEDGELKSTLKADPDTAKAFISRTKDKARMAYAKYPTSVPRGFVLVGTTNRSQFLSDMTGNRRFVPIECGATAPAIDIFGPDGDFYAEQLWAEMRQAYKDGTTRLYLSDDEQKLAQEAQEASTVENEQVECVLDYLAAKKVGDRVCIQELKDVASDGIKPVHDSFIKLIVDNKTEGRWEWSGSKKASFGSNGARRYYTRVR